MLPQQLQRIVLITACPPEMACHWRVHLVDEQPAARRLFRERRDAGLNKWMRTLHTQAFTLYANTFIWLGTESEQAQVDARDFGRGVL